MGCPLTSRRIWPCRNVLPMLMARTNIQPPAFLYNRFCMPAIDLSQADGVRDWREGYGVRKEVMQDSQPSVEGDWILWAGSGYLSCWPQFARSMAIPCKVTG